MTDLARKEEIAQARSVAGQIRQGIHNYLSTLSLIARANKERHWQILGYADWQTYIDGEFGAERLRLPAEHRQKAVEELRLGGMSVRAISAAVGVATNTVLKDLSQSETPDEIVGRDGKTYQTPARRDPEPANFPGPAVATPGEPDQPEGAVAVREDAAAAPSAEPERKANRRPLVDAFRDAAYDLVKVAERVERLVLDDRFPRNAEQVGQLCRADLLRAGDLLATAVSRVPNLTKEPTE